MSIITSAYFASGELKLPIDNISDIQYFIDEHEKILLKGLLGYSLYNDFITALAGTPATKWTELRDGKEYTYNDILKKYEGIQYILADYTFFRIVSDKQTYTTDGGVKFAMTDNADGTNPRNKQTYVWNDMVERIKTLDEFIEVSNEADDSTYPDYEPDEFDYIGLRTKTNMFNI